MSWFPLEQALWTHRKTYALAEGLGIDEVHAGGLVARLWSWSLDNARADFEQRRGLLTGVVHLAIARGAGWKHDADAFVQALVCAGFLDQDGDDLVIHDWFDYAGRLLERRKKDRERKRARAARTRVTAGRTPAIRRKALPQEGRALDAERTPIAADNPVLTVQKSTVQNQTLSPPSLSHDDTDLSVQDTARAPDASGTLTLEPTATSPPASRHAANGGERGARGGETRLGDTVRRRGAAAPVPSRPAGGTLPAQAVPLRAVPKPHELERAQTEAHPLYEPLVALLGRPPTRDLPEWRDDLAALDEMGATPEDIPRAVAGYAQTMGCDATGRPILLTRAALVRHWYRCLDAPEDSPSAEHTAQEAGAVAWARRTYGTAEAAP